MLALRGYCIPTPQGPSEDRKLSLGRRGFAEKAKTGAIVSLSLAGVAGLSIGLIEYFSSFVNRIKGKSLEHENIVAEENLGRSRKKLDREYQNAGMDILLDLVEKSSLKKGVEKEHNQNETDQKSSDEEDTEPEGLLEGVPLDMKDETKNSETQVNLEGDLKDKEPETSDPETPDLPKADTPEPSLSDLQLPPLPGFPPLSAPKEW